MDVETLRAGRQAVVDVHGPWRWHNVALPFGEFTIDALPHGDNHRAAKFVQLASDLLRRRTAELRVLDLGSGEGLYALEFAQGGAEVVAVEARDANLAKSEFARRALGLERVRFVQDDVRRVSRERLGVFDLILCSGILYHLDAASAVAMLREMQCMCSGVCLIDTRVALAPNITLEVEGGTYGGAMYREHAPEASDAQKLADPGASLDNEESFWFTRHSLSNALLDLGYSSVLECLGPVPLQLRPDRVTLAAFPGPRVRAHHEVGHDLAARRWPSDQV